MARRPSAGPVRAAVVTAVALGALVSALGGPTPPDPGVAAPAARTAPVEVAPVRYGPFAPDRPATAPAAPPVPGPPAPAPDPAPVPPAGAATVVGGSGGGLPARVRLAYERAAAAADPACGLDWPLLAGIGHVESGHARGGRLDATGRPTTPIVGLPLDGGPGVRAIGDSDDGRYDGDTVWDRAVGPMQFIPGTWAGYGTDGDGDGAADPHQIDDAAHAAARYLCAGGADLRTAAGARSAVLRYNLSAAYATRVLLLAQAYRSGLPVGPLPAIGATPNGSAGDGGAPPADAPPAGPDPLVAAPPTAPAAGPTLAPAALPASPVPPTSTPPAAAPPVTSPPATPPAATPPATPAPVPPVTTPPVTTPPVTTPPVTTPPVTTPPLVTPPPVEPPAPSADPPAAPEPTTPAPQPPTAEPTGAGPESTTAATTTAATTTSATAATGPTSPAPGSEPSPTAPACDPPPAEATEACPAP